MREEQTQLVLPASLITRHVSYSSRDRSPAIQPNHLACDVAAVGREEVNELRDVVGCPWAGERDATQILLALRLRIIVRPLDHAGGDAVYGHFGCKLAGEAEREVRERRLARA